MTERGTHDRVTLRFIDDDLERRFQLVAGRESLAGRGPLETYLVVDRGVGAAIA